MSRHCEFCWFRSGSAADTQAVTDVVKYKLNFAEIEQGRPASVRDAAVAFKEICYEYRDSLMAGLIVAGWDAASQSGQVGYSTYLHLLTLRHSFSAIMRPNYFSRWLVFSTFKCKCRVDCSRIYYKIRALMLCKVT